MQVNRYVYDCIYIYISNYIYAYPMRCIVQREWRIWSLLKISWSSYPIQYIVRRWRQIWSLMKISGGCRSGLETTYHINFSVFIFAGSELAFFFHVLVLKNVKNLLLNGLKHHNVLMKFDGEWCRSLHHEEWGVKHQDHQTCRFGRSNTYNAKRMVISCVQIS